MKNSKSEITPAQKIKLNNLRDKMLGAEHYIHVCGYLLRNAHTNNMGRGFMPCLEAAEGLKDGVEDYMSAMYELMALFTDPRSAHWHNPNSGAAFVEWIESWRDDIGDEEVGALGIKEPAEYENAA